MKRMWSKNELARQVKEVKKDITTLVDKDGHPRFIEGVIEPNEITGITWTYGKWSLSGTHLMIVLAGSAVSDSYTYQEFAQFKVPQWVFDKIVSIFSDTIAYKAVNAYDSALNIQTMNVKLEKLTDAMQIFLNNSISLSSEKAFRIEFDLLIDNE